MNQTRAPARGIALLFSVGLASLGLAACDACGKSGGAKNTTGVAELAVGSGQACVRMVDASVWCWGSNRLGSAGVKGRSPTQQFHTTPQKVANVSATRLFVVGIRTCFEATAGGVSCWGGEMHDEDAHPSPLAGFPRGRLVASESTGCAITTDGSATCFGEDTSGRLSPGDESAVRQTFGRRREPNKLALDGPITQIAIGGRHGCALGQDKNVSCWGLNNFGQLGADRVEVQQSAKPRVIEGLDGVVELDSGHFHTCALKGDGTVWCWGRGDNGQLGIGDGLEGTGEHRHAKVPTKVKDLPTVEHIYAESSETCATTKKGALYCWGHNDKGQIGDGTSENRFTAVEIKGIDDVRHVSIGYAMVCALDGRGRVSCWGDNNDGQLGNGGVETSPRPALVKLPSGIGAPVPEGNGGTPRPAPPAPATPVEGSEVRKPGELSTYESIACGFRLKAPGRRVWAARDDLTMESIAIEPLASNTKIEARCTKKKSQADKDPDALAKRFADDDAGASVPTARKKIGDADCLVLSQPSSRSIFCYTAEHFVSLNVRSTLPKLIDDVTGSLELFDPSAAIPPPPAPEPDKARPGMIAIAAGEFAMGCPNESLLGGKIGSLGCVEAAQPMHRVRLSAFSIDQKPSDTKGVSWDQAVTQCASRKLRLPTEAEWERALRAGAIVRSGKEWVADGFAKTYYLESPLDDPKGPASSIHRVVRGTSLGPPEDALMYRYGREPSFAGDEIGFRCAVSR